jgi:cysteinyl-tRNA synthetase
VRSLRVSVANNLPALREESLRKLASAGFGAEIADDGNITLVPLTQAARNFDKEIEDLISARNIARKSRNFAEADRIRDELKARRIVLKDNKDGTTTWEVER